MEGIVCACIAPHGSEVIPELAAVGAVGGGTPVGGPVRDVGPDRVAEALAGYGRLTAAMEEVARRVRLADPETIVVATPHSLRLDGGHTAIVTAESVAGSLTAETPRAAGGSDARAAGERATVEAVWQVDRDLAGDILRRARARNLPVVGANYGAASGGSSRLPLDWGALIPLYFLGRTPEARPEGSRRPEVVLIGPSRDGRRESLVELGEAVAESAAASGKRVVFVASADHGHTHLPNGPFGFDPAAVAYDRLVCDIVRQDRLDDLLGIAPDLLEAAKPDSLWPMLILAGVKRRRAMTAEFLAYERPTYYGMLVAFYQPIGCRQSPPAE